MATRLALVQLGATRSKMWSTRRAGGSMSRYFSDAKGRVLSEEELAAEKVYIQKMEKEKMEKKKKKAEKEMAEKEKQGADKKTVEGHAS